MIRSLMLALPLILLGASFSGPGFSRFTPLDFCVPFVERATDRHTACTWSPTKQRIADSVIFGTLGAHYMLRASEVDTPSTQGETLDAPLPAALVPYARYSDACYDADGGNDYWRLDEAEDFADSIAALRTRAAPIQWVLWPRIDLMSFTEMALPGVDQSWFATTGQSWATTLANITGDTSTVCTTTCGGACAHSYYFANNASERHSVPAYADSVSPQTTSAWQTFVYYWPHPDTNDICNTFESSVVVKINNANYRAWKVARLVAMIGEAPWAWGFEFDTKFFYRVCRDGSRVFREVEHYLGGTRLPDCTVPSGGTMTMQHYNNTNDTPFSAPPTAGTGGMDWKDYVQGYRAMMEALKASGVRVQLRMSHLYPWWKSEGGWSGYTGDNCGGSAGVACDYFDDPATTDYNENDDVVAIYRAAARVIYTKTTNSYTNAAAAAVKAELASYGAELVQWDTSCGEAP